MINRILSRDNLILALNRVEKNKGSHGIDHMPVQNLRRHVYEHWHTLKQHLESGTYKPAPVRRIEIPKTDGGVRLLGIPTVVDRFIQQAIAQVLTQEMDRSFSDHSYGFRPGRKQHDAVRKARRYIQQGKRWVVDMDMEKFFDRINHEKMIGVLSKRITDPTVLKLIYRYLQSGAMINGVVIETSKGAPQGGPLSPILSNILLDELDQELEKRGHKFVRFADDFMIYVKSRKAGERVKQSITNFLEKTLKLKVNQEKSAVDRPWRRKFLGFSFLFGFDTKVRLHKKSVIRFKRNIRRLTSRSWSISIEERIDRLNQYLVGWCGYFALADTPTVFKKLDQWIRRRLRMCLWKTWKTPKTRIKRLISLGVSKDKAYEWGNTRKGYWRIANSPILDSYLTNSYWHHQGLRSLEKRYKFLRQPKGTASY